MRFVLPATVAWIAVLGPGETAAGPIDAFGVLWGGAMTGRSLEQSGQRPGDSTGRAWGWALGGYIEWRLPWRHFNLVTEISQLEKGYSRSTGGFVMPAGLQRSDTVVVVDTYLSVPVLLVRDLGTGRLQPFAFAGPSLEVLTGRTRIVEAEGLSRSNAAVHLGLGVRWMGKVETRVRYIRDITDSIARGPGSLQAVRHRGLVISGGIRLPI